MAAPTTEIATLVLKAGSNPEDPNTPEGKICQETIATVGSQPGVQAIYYGRQVEDQNLMKLFIDWDNLDAHKTFMTTDIYQPFVKNLMSIVDQPPDLFHAKLNPAPATDAFCANAPGATEVLTLLYPTDISTADQEAVAKNMAALANSLKAEGARGFSGGWAIEERDSEKAEGGKAKAFVGAIGWDSVDAHMTARGTQTFKDNIHYVTDVPLVDRSVVHVHLTKV